MVRRSQGRACSTTFHSKGSCRQPRPQRRQGGARTTHWPLATTQPPMVTRRDPTAGTRGDRKRSTSPPERPGRRQSTMAPTSTFPSPRFCAPCGTATATRPCVARLAGGRDRRAAHPIRAVVNRAGPHGLRAAQDVRAEEPLPHAGVLSPDAGVSLRLAVHLREVRRGHAVFHLLLPAGNVPAIPCGARAQEAELVRGGCALTPRLSCCADCSGS